ncbi:MAG: flagellar export protein FliJ [Lachnospiraceae bacterium]|nr:flagellar export protein FliJ [Lachnospiraceae bacterium]MDE6233615.1 flagellar export protein FliJ [Lachnospiraceae bacterium]MDE6253716.1 flagellar export protein FliJ [Lachnospiraceae bacterium]
MAKFIYKMQSILDIKYKLENQAKSEYAAAMAILQQEKFKLEEINADINKYEDDLRTLQSGIIDVMQLRECTEALEYKKRALQAQKIVVQRSENRVERSKEKLNEVMVDRKTHEKLKEKAFEEFLQELSAQENKEIDELVSFQYNNQDTGEN